MTDASRTLRKSWTAAATRSGPPEGGDSCLEVGDGEVLAHVARLLHDAACELDVLLGVGRRVQGAADVYLDEASHAVHLALVEVRICQSDVAHKDRSTA